MNSQTAAALSLHGPTLTSPMPAKSQSPVMLPGAMISQPAPTIQDIEMAAKGDPRFAVERQRARQVSLGLNVGAAHKFTEECEFVSLGCYCGVSCAMQAAGLRRSAYPFDWVRSSVDGVIHCLESDFVDFLTFSSLRVEAEHQGFLSARWGGSFWHHKPDQPKVREEFTRRIERMLGLGKVPPTQPRVFIRAVNSTRELDATIDLHQSLQRALPQATVYLIVLIDLQEETGPLRLKNGPEHLIFYRIHKSVWEPPIQIQKVDDPYSEAIAFAVHYWTGREASRAEVKEYDNIVQLNAVCQQFDGGSPATELMAPKPLIGTPITLRRRSIASKTAPNSDMKQDLDSSSVETAISEFGQAPLQLALAHEAPSSTSTRSSNRSPELKDSNSRQDALQSAIRWESSTARSLLLPGSSNKVVMATSVSEGYSQEGEQLRFASVRLPDNAKSGDVVCTEAFGRKVMLEVPLDVAAEQMVQLQLINGVVFCAAAATMTASAVVAACESREHPSSCPLVPTMTVHCSPSTNT